MGVVVCGVVVRSLYRIERCVFWWRIRDLVSSHRWGDTIDLWLRDIWMISSVWHRHDGRGPDTSGLWASRSRSRAA